MKNEINRWVVVDDNGRTLELLGDLLEMMDCAEVLRFSSGADAVDALAAAPEDIQLVVTDLEMPGMDGVELCRNVRRLAPHAKVLLVSGNHNVTELQALLWGFDRFLAKPFSASALLETLASVGVSSAQKQNFLEMEAAHVAA